VVIVELAVAPARKLMENNISVSWIKTRSQNQNEPKEANGKRRKSMVHKLMIF
jgi:hypothetical protein